MSPRFLTAGCNCPQLGSGKAAGGGFVGRMEFRRRQCARGRCGMLRRQLGQVWGKAEARDWRQGELVRRVHAQEREAADCYL